MNKRFISAIAIAMVLIMGLAGCTQAVNEKSASVEESKPEEATITEEAKTEGMIYLYGEMHSEEKILDKEIELWDDYYDNQGMRHLFIESAYYTSEFLNLWMKADNDDILIEVFNDWKGTQSYSLETLSFYKKIKEMCPETVFHGTDVGHQYDTTGARFLKYLEDNELTDTEQYKLTQEAIHQGKYYYNNRDDKYRENMMVENFKREFDKLDNQSIMGIYGGAHTGIESMAYKNPKLPCMANQLNDLYPGIIISEDLSYLLKNIEAIRVDTVTLDGKEYQASYYGEQDLTGFKNFKSREFWRIEDAYEDFKDKPKTGDYLPADNYNMTIEKNQLYMIDYTMTDNSKTRLYYRCDDREMDGMLVTEQIKID